jgi:hypothetical protein
MGSKVNDDIFEFSLGEASEDTALPIPPIALEEVKNSSARKETIPSNIQEVIDIKNNFEYSYSGIAKDFVNDAKKYVNFFCADATLISFMSYWPTYSSMTEPQRNWYFYWRNQVRKGFYPDTDLSYIFIHIYELINNIGVKDADDSCSQLCLLWLNYRERYPRLDRYLTDWVTDYILLNKCSIDAAMALHNVTGGHLFNCSVDLLLPFYIDSTLDRLPLELIYQLSYYTNLPRSSFYKGIGKALMDEYIPKVLQILDVALKKNTGLGIFDKLKPAKTESILRYPFKSAVYFCKENAPIIIEVLPYSKHFPLKTFITGVLKCSENKLRELTGVSGRLKNFSIDIPAKNIIEQYLAKEHSNKINELTKVEVKLDEEKLSKLAEDSKSIRTTLLSDIASEEASQVDTTLEANPISTIYREKNKEVASLHTSQALSSMSAEWSDFYSALQPYHISALEIILSSCDVSERLNKICEDNFIMQELLIDSINEAALETIGDIIILPDVKPPCFIEEYYEFIKKLFI